MITLREVVYLVSELILSNIGGVRFASAFVSGWIGTARGRRTDGSFWATALDILGLGRRIAEFWDGVGRDYIESKDRNKGEILESGADRVYVVD